MDRQKDRQTRVKIQPLSNFTDADNKSVKLMWQQNTK